MRVRKLRAARCMDAAEDAARMRACPRSRRSACVVFGSSLHDDILSDISVDT